MKIKVKFINGNDIFYDSNESDILSLKKLIANDKDTSIDNIKLIYRGKILKNEESLEQHKIDETSTLHCVVRKSNLNNNSTNATHSNLNSNPTNTTQSNLNNSLADLNNNLNNTISNTFNSVSNLNNLFSNINLSENNIPNIEDPNILNQINTMYQIPQFRELIISNTLNRMNLPIDSPYRHVIESNISALLQNPQMANQIINNFNNLNQNNNNSPSNQNLQTTNETDNENSIVNNEPEFNFNELKEKYTSELEEIKNMGFDDEELILKTLDQSQGSVVISINKLLN